MGPTFSLQDFKITTDMDEMDLSVIHEFLSNSYWAKGIQLPTLQAALANSLCFAVINADGAQVGFARVITDRATFAYLADVFVIDGNRGVGLSKRLIKAVVEHPDLQGLRRFVLATKDAHGLYEQFGFKPLTHPDTFMEIWIPDIYSRT